MRPPAARARNGCLPSGTANRVTPPRAAAALGPGVEGTRVGAVVTVGVLVGVGEGLGVAGACVAGAVVGCCPEVVGAGCGAKAMLPLGPRTAKRARVGSKVRSLPAPATSIVPCTLPAAP